MSTEHERLVLDAAARGDRLGFAAASCRYGSLADAQRLVREQGVVRQVERLRRNGSGALTLAAAVRTELRSAEVEDREGEPADPVMHGHFTVFDEWTEIDSWFEGRFKERIAPGAFKKTFRENRGDIEVLFQHGYDPVAGDKPLGRAEVLREEDFGPYYEVPLLDAPYVRNDILPGLRAGVYGASFQFTVMREEFEQKPERSDDNPEGLPERTIKEARVFEFGPVTFPAYPSATAAVRATGEALTGEEVEQLRSLLRNAPAVQSAEAEPHPANGSAAAEPHPEPARRVPPITRRREEAPRWPTR